MATQFQTRLVGTVILVAVGVIFFPEVLDGDKKQKEPLFESIPLQPSNNEKKPLIEFPKSQDPKTVQELQNSEHETLKSPLVQSKEPVISEAVELSEPKTKNQESIATSSLDNTIALVEPTKPSVKQTDFTDSAWIIQMGYFNNADNALALTNKLIKAGYQAHTDPEHPMHGHLTRVFIGPNLSKVKLEKEINSLYKLTKIKGKILPFKPLEPGA